jgi:hypothetical protein
MGISAAAEWVTGAGANKGKVTGTPTILTGAAYTQDVDCVGKGELSIAAIMTGAASGDMTLAVFPVYPDGTVGAVGITPSQINGPTFGTNVQVAGNYDVSGYDRVRISIKNNNAGSQTLQEFTWKLSGTGG